MLKVASQLLKDNGIILYMVCSFLKDESTNQVDHFLSNNNNFSVTDFSLNNDHSKNLFFIKNKKLLIIPSQINEYNIECESRVTPEFLFFKAIIILGIRNFLFRNFES